MSEQGAPEPSAWQSVAKHRYIDVSRETAEAWQLGELRPLYTLEAARAGYVRAGVEREEVAREIETAAQLMEDGARRTVAALHFRDVARFVRSRSRGTE